MRKEIRKLHDRESLKKIFKYAKKTIIYIVIILLFTIVLQSLKIRVDKEYIPSILGHTYLNVLTESMNPEFYPKDLIIGAKVKDTSKLKIGDIITFKDSNMLVTHRIVEVTGNGNTFATKGDANTAIDEKKVSSNQVISKYSFKIPKGGVLISKMQNIQFLALAWIIIMYYISKEIFKEVKLIRANKKSIE
ncbi:signal peptidase I [Clostridium sp.]|uniref:signal peptidase I n=1 Tax=Clostridium sp. TaxID=1506 RepID=UPI0032164851